MFGYIIKKIIFCKFIAASELLGHLLHITEQKAIYQ